MERIKHHFCWVKSVSGPRKAAPTPAGVGLADMSMAWSPGHASMSVSPAVEEFSIGTLEPRHAGVPPAKPKTKAAEAARAAKATAALEPKHAGVPPAKPKTKAAEAADTARAAKAAEALEFRQAGVPPASPLAATSLKSLVPPPPPAYDPDTGVKNGPVPPAPVQMIFAGASMAGAWAFDGLRLTGAPDGGGLRHEFQVVIGDKSEAYAWLNGPDGRKWLLDAKAVSLITFAVMGVY